MKMSDFDGENWTEKFSQRNKKKSEIFLQPVDDVRKFS